MMIDKVKTALRVNGNAFDSELEGLIATATADLQTIIDTPIDTDNPLVTQAIICYCKAYWGYDDVNIADRFAASYMSIKTQLAVLMTPEVIARED